MHTGTIPDATGRTKIIGVASPDGTPVADALDPLTGEAVARVFAGAEQAAAGLFSAGVG